MTMLVEGRRPQSRWKKFLHLGTKPESHPNQPSQTVTAIQAFISNALEMVQQYCDEQFPPDTPINK